MKILVVTSEVTFVPKNYNLFLEELFKGLLSEKSLTIDLVILKNNSPMLVIKALALMLMGAPRIGLSLMQNALVAPFKDRKKIANTYGIEMHFFDNPNSTEFLNFVATHQTDLIVNARTRFIYKSKILKLPRLAAINIHHGLLPDYRGTMCDLWALKDDRPTGFTIHVMDKKIDNGAIIKKTQTSTHGDLLRNNFAQLIKESSRLEGIEMSNTIKIINKEGRLPIEEQNISKHPVYTKNPDFKTIRMLTQKGIKL
jgi:methionyl-tRNA formyltransferase